MRMTDHVPLGKLLVKELWFEVPLDHSEPESSRTIRLFARSAIRFEKPIVDPPEQAAKEASQRPYLVFLQGGPGFGNPAPQDSPLSTHMLDRGYELLLLDYRGTGLSCPVSADTLAAAVGSDPQAQADYLKLFRADSIVRDLEAVRLCLTREYPPEKRTWSIFGQSFGGMTAITYLSFAPGGLREAFITGGLAALDKGPAEVYQSTYRRCIERNRLYYAKFPGDVATVRRVAERIQELGGDEGVPLPAGGRLTVQNLLTLGIHFGGDGGLDRIHNLVAVRMRADLEQFGFLTRATLNAFEQDLGFDVAPIYAVLHEACWMYGPGFASAWAADRVGQSLGEYRWLREDFTLSSLAPDEPLYFLGEMVPRFHFAARPELARLLAAADLLAAFDRWPPLYDLAQLARNDVPVYAAAYNDMYVDSDLARETARRIRGIKVFETNMLFHGALRTKPDEVFRALLSLRDDTID